MDKLLTHIRASEGVSATADTHIWLVDMHTDDCCTVSGKTGGEERRRGRDAGKVREEKRRGEEMVV